METKPTLYTKDFVQSELLGMLNDIKADKEIIYIGQLFESRPYSRQRYSEWAKEFKDFDEISDIIKKIENILETRINVGAIKGTLNPTMVIFNLKNKYGWKDTTDHNVKLDNITKVEFEVKKNDSSTAIDAGAGEEPALLSGPEQADNNQPGRDGQQQVLQSGATVRGDDDPGAK